MTDERSGIRAIDSLSANEFHVELEGESASGIFGVHGLCVRCVEGNGAVPTHKPLTISKMVQQDPALAFNRWTRETLAQPAMKVTRDLAIVALDEGIETRRWIYRGAWISDITYSDFDMSRDELIEERLTIQHEGVEEIWPAR